MTNATSTYGMKTPAGDFFNATVSERTSVRHSNALVLEGTAHDWDQSTHPYTNWGFENRLDWMTQTGGQS